MVQELNIQKGWGQPVSTQKQLQRTVKIRFIPELKASNSNLVTYSIWLQPIPCRIASIAT